MTDISKLYAAAFSYYEQGNYAEASSLFTQLVLRNPFEVSYWRGLASSQQMQGQYQEALQAWSMVAIINNEEAMAHFHAAECFVSLGETQESLKALDVAAQKCSEDFSLKHRIEELKNICLA